MADRDATVDPIITIEGKKLEERYETSLLEVIVDTRLEGPDVFELTFHDPAHELMTTGEEAVGDEVNIDVKLESAGGHGLIKGEITALEVGFGPKGSVYVIRGYDRTHRLFRSRESVAYTNKKYSDLARAIARKHDLRAQVDKTKVVHDHILRVNQTDWEFLSDLAREIGYEVGGHNGVLYFRKPSEAGSAPEPRDGPAEDALVLQSGVNLLDGRVGVSAAAQTREVIVHGWDRKQKELVKAQAAAETVMAATAEQWTPKQLAGKVNGNEFVATDTSYRTHAEADEVAGGLNERHASVAAEFVGVAVGHPDLRAGKAVSVGGFGPRFNGKYTLTAARHLIIPKENYHTEIVASGVSDTSLLALTGGAGDEERGHRTRMPGVGTALVTNVKDPEDMSRVKVMFPWLDDNQESDWAPVAQLFAGNGYGAMFLPEVGDEVLVAFDHGDPRHPFVIGSLYNGEDKPDKKTSELVGSDGKINTRRLVTRSNHGLVFFDESGKQGLRLRTGSEKVSVDLNQTDKKILITNKEGRGTVEVDASGKITIKGGADVDVQATGGISFDAKGDFKVDATNITLKAKTNATFEGNAKTEVKSGVQASINGGATTEIKGGIVRIN